MRLIRAEIRRMPGLPEGYTLEGLESVVVLLGPNGSGKSTLRRALQALLWPDREPSLDVSLRFEWREGEVALVVEREGARVTWNRDGRPCEPPPLPPDALAPSLSFGSEDLVAADETAQGQARAIAAELAGGYELEPLIARRAIPPGSQRKVHLDWVEAREHVNELQAQQRSLADEERELSSLEESLAEATSARARVSRTRDALRYAEARAREAQAEAGLAEFPPGMERLAGDELSRLEELDARRETLIERRGKATVRTHRAEKELESLRLPAEVDAAQLRRAREDLEEVRRLEERVGEEEAQRESLERRRDAAAARAGGAGEPPTLSARDADELQRALEQEWRVRQEMLSLDAELAALRQAESERAEPEPARHAAHELRASLAGERGGAGAWRFVGALCAFVAGVGAWAAFRGEALPGSMVGALVLVALAALAFWRARRPAGRAKILPLLRELGIPEPARWSRAELERTLRALDEEVSRREGEARLRERSADLDARRAPLEEEREAAGDTRRATLRACGLDPELSGLALGELAAALREWRSLHDEVERTRAVIEGRRARIEALSRSIESLLRSAETVCASTSAAYRVELDRLDERLARARELRREAEDARADASQRESEFEGVAEEQSRLLSRLGLGEDELDELARRIERLDAYRAARRELDQAQAVSAEIRARMKLDVKAEDPERLRTELEELERLAEPEDDLRERVFELRARISSAREGHELELALAAEEAARAAVLDERDDELDGALGALLLRRASRRHARSAMPPRLAHASELLGRFTQRRYGLEIAGEVDEAQRFVARDNVEKKTLPLDKLSSGTRSQLLLAARVAFATAEEGTNPLPLFLDETLSQADPERFRAVAQALLLLAREGRQVFYLTCQPADAALWREEAARVDGSLLAVRDLAELRGLAWSREIPAHDSRPPEVPDPKGLSAQEYARELGVPPLDPYRDVAASHLFHPLAEQRELLRVLLGSSIERVGQWGVFEESGVAAALLGGDEPARRVRVRVKALEVFVEAWRQGRGTPLTREVLADAGVSDAFMEQVIELAKQEGWDAARVLAGLREKKVRRFRTSAILAIEEALVERGCVDPRESLDEHQLRARVYHALADELEEGALGRDELNALFERWLAAVSRPASCPR